MVILKGKIFKQGNSYAKRVSKSLIDSNLIEEGEYYDTILLSSQLSEEQKKFLDRIVNQLGSHMIAQQKDPKDVDLYVAKDDSRDESTGQDAVEPVPEISILGRASAHLDFVTSEDRSERGSFQTVRNPWLSAQCQKA